MVSCRYLSALYLVRSLNERKIRTEGRKNAEKVGLSKKAPTFYHEKIFKNLSLNFEDFKSTNSSIFSKFTITNYQTK